MICRICEASISNDVQLHFQRHYEIDIPLKIHEKIIAHVRDLIIQSIQNMSISSKEIEMIEGIKVNSGFKYTTEFECQKIENIIDSMKKHYKITHD